MRVSDRVLLMATGGLIAGTWDLDTPLAERDSAWIQGTLSDILP